MFNFSAYVYNVDNNVITPFTFERTAITKLFVDTSSKPIKRKSLFNCFTLDI